MSRRAAVRTAALALLGAGIVFVIGTSYRVVWDLEETCRLTHGQRFDPATASSRSLLPLSQPCNASYDLVPAFVNPTLVALTALAITAAVVAALAPKTPPDDPDR